jgi:hypothetical protein
VARVGAGVGTDIDFHQRYFILRVGHRYAKSDAMPTEQKTSVPPAAGTAEHPTPEQRPLTPAARRALEEAAARRAERDRNQAEQAKETGGRGGLEPTRYGDWEVSGLTSDF